MDGDLQGREAAESEWGWLSKPLFLELREHVLSLAEKWVDTWMVDAKQDIGGHPIAGCDREMFREAIAALIVEVMVRGVWSEVEPRWDRSLVWEQYAGG